MRFAFITEGISDCTVMVVAILHSCIRTRTWWRHQMGTFSASLNSPHKGQWRGALRFSLICAWINGWVNNRETGDLRRHRAHNDVIVMNCYDITVCKHWHQYNKTIFVTHNSNNYNSTTITRILERYVSSPLAIKYCIKRNYHWRYTRNSHMEVNIICRISWGYNKS